MGLEGRTDPFQVDKAAIVPGSDGLRKTTATPRAVRLAQNPPLSSLGSRLAGWGGQKF